MQTPSKTPKNSRITAPLAVADDVTLSPADYEKFAAESQSKITELTSTNLTLLQRIDALESQLRLYKKQRFLSRPEQAKAIADSMADLFPESLEQALAELNIPSEAEVVEEASTPVAAHSSKPRKPRTLSADLPRVEVIHDLDESEKTCDDCGQTMKPIGYEPPLEQLAIIPAKHYVIRHLRTKYACECKLCIKRAAMPAQPIPKSQVSPALLAFLMVSKFLDGLPLYRLEKITARYGLDVSRQTMARWLIQGSEWLTRLTDAFAVEHLEYDILAADETRLQVLNEPDRDPTSQSWLWIRRGGPPDQLSIAIDYHPSRAGTVADTLLADYRNGYLITDAYAGYYPIAKANQITLVGCHDHARRTFKEAYDSLSFKARRDPCGIAKQALVRYQALYKIEKEIKLQSLKPEAILKLRQQKSLPLLNAFQLWLLKVQKQGVVHEKTKIAVQYFLNQFQTLIRYCEDGRLPISNILSEHIAKAIAIARKNFLFANSQSGAIACARIYFVVLTAAQHNLNPLYYMTWVLTQLPNLKDQSIDHLMPWNTNPEQLKTFFDQLPKP